MQRIRKAQISFEFLMIFALVFAVIIAFIAIINIRLSEINEQQELLLMKNLANSIKNEILLASSVHDNYIRKFDVPPNINGKEYKLEISQDELNIRVIESNNTVGEYFTVFPVPVKGNFIDNITFNSTEHCITKNDYDGIRIARTQASLDSNVTMAVAGDTFEVVVSLNCVENIRSARFTINYDNEKLELLRDETEPIFKKNPDNRQLNPLFDDIEIILFYSDQNLGEQYNSLPFMTESRYTYAFLAKDCAYGSGSVAKMRFRVIEEASGTTEIKFDDNFQDQDVVVLDCKTNKFTRGGLPATRSDLRIILN